MDIIIFEVKWNGCLKIIDKLGYGGLGGIIVNRIFKSVLEEILIEEIIESYCYEFI